MKKLIQSKTIWFNSILIAAPIIIELINLVDSDLLDALGFDNSSKITRVLSFVVGAIGIVLRLQTSSPIGVESTDSRSRYPFDVYENEVQVFCYEFTASELSEIGLQNPPLGYVVFRTEDDGLTSNYFMWNGVEWTIGGGGIGLPRKKHL